MIDDAKYTQHHINAAHPGVLEVCPICKFHDSAVCVCHNSSIAIGLIEHHR